MRPRVSSRPAFFRCSGDGASRRLESSILRPSALWRAQRVNLRVAPHLLCCDASESPRLRDSDASAVARSPHLHLPALPAVSSRVAPRSLIPGCHRRMAAASCLAQHTLRRRPRCVREPLCGLSRGLSHVLRLRLGRCDSPTESKPCIPGVAEDESLLTAGSCTFPAGSGCNLD